MGYNTLIVLTGTGLLGACSGMVGSFAVLRRRALMGDALAHAALPGVCLAFLLIGERHLPGMLLGAFVTGILGIAIVTGLRFGTRIKEDAAIGIVLSVFYGAGIALSRTIQNQTVSGSRAGLESYILGKTSGMIMNDIVLIGAASLFCLCLVLLLYKEFKVVAFDPGFASVQGWPSFQIDLVLMAMIAVTVVIGLPAVGVVLVAALLIIPAAAARFWTDRLGMLLGLSAIAGAVSGGLGTLASSQFGWSAGPSIVLAGTSVFLVSLIFSPKRGLFRRVAANMRLARTMADAKTLRKIFVLFEEGRFTTARFAEHALARNETGLERSMRMALSRLVRQGLLESIEAAEYRVTARCWKRIVETVWNYRLWEQYLDDSAGTISQMPDEMPAATSESIPPESLARYEAALIAEGRDPRSISLGGVEGATE